MFPYADHQRKQRFFLRFLLPVFLHSVIFFKVLLFASNRVALRQPVVPKNDRAHHDELKSIDLDQVTQCCAFP